MDPVLLVLGVGGLVGGPVVAGLALWRLVAARQPEVAPGGSVERLGRHVVLRTFEAGPVRVSCEELGVGRPVVVLTAPVPAEVWVEPVRPLRLAERPFGDEAFDRVFESGGAVSLLTAPVRGALLEVARHHQVRVIGGALEVRWAARLDDDERLEPLLAQVRAVLDAFPATPEEGAYRIATADPVPELRVRAVRRLVDAGDPRADGVLDAALVSGIPTVEVAAALIRSDLPALRRILRSDAPADVRRDALDALVAHDDEALLAPFLHEALGEPGLASDVVSAVARRPRPALASAVVERMRVGVQHLPDSQRADVVRALAALATELPPGDGVEDLLVALLAAEDPRVRRTAARTLAAVGTPRAIPALRAALEAAGPTVPIREAIDAIRARAARDEGALSVPAGSTGALSPAEVPGGQLADPREPDAG